MDNPKQPKEDTPVEEWLAVACMALLALLTLLNVLTRYLTDQDFAWTEEVSVFAMLVMTLSGAAAAAARDRHIRIEYFLQHGNDAQRRRLSWLSALTCGVVFAVLAVLFGVVVADEYRYGETSMGLGVPRWWYTGFAPILCALIAWRSIAFAWRESGR